MSWNPYKDRRDLRSNADAATDRIRDQSEEIVRLHGMVESRDQRLRAKVRGQRHPSRPAPPGLIASPDRRRRKRRRSGTTRGPDSGTQVARIRVARPGSRRASIVRLVDRRPRRHGPLGHARPDTHNRRAPIGCALDSASPGCCGTTRTT